MRAEIASIHERMAQGGNWRDFRDEIASLHKDALAEDEYVTLLEAFDNLTRIGPLAFDDVTWTRLEPVTRAEYRNLLSAEALEADGWINPAKLGGIVQREIDAHRLSAEDEFARLAMAGAAVLGDSRLIAAARKPYGDWFFYGTTAAAAAAAWMTHSWSPLWLIAVGFLVGWYINDRQIKRLKLDIQATDRGNR